MSKLYELTGATFRLPYASDAQTRKVSSIPADNIPCMRWPNGRWCVAANLYMLQLFERGLSRRGVGGTLTTYAANISHLIRFCFSRRVDFHELSDVQFTAFVKQLIEEKDIEGDRLRTDNHVIAVVRNCLDFLEFVADNRSDENLLGFDGRIRAYKRIRGGSRLNIPSARWCHLALPMPDVIRRRHPISTENINAIRSKIIEASASVYQRRRRYVMLRCLEMTGGRRIEVASMKVSDIAEAIKSPNHQLSMLTAKRRGGKVAYRRVPCSLLDLQEIWDFVQTARKRVVRDTIGPSRDHGFLLINERTGQPLRPNTITQEIFTLARLAGVEVSASPHLFRHRYITKIFVCLIRQLDASTPLELRRALVGVSEVKQQLMEWAGHLSPDSLDRYIDLAFAEVDGVKISVNSLEAEVNLVALRVAVDNFAAEQAESGNMEVALRLQAILASSNG